MPLSAKCGSYKFLHRDTVNVDWTNAALQQYVCDQTATNGVIQNTIVFTHSMGTLILGGAIANGRCSFGSGATWYTVSVRACPAHTMLQTCARYTVDICLSIVVYAGPHLRQQGGRLRELHLH